MGTQIAEMTVAASVPPPTRVKASGRLVSLDAYRGFIMLLLASSGFGLSVLAKSGRLSALSFDPDSLLQSLSALHSRSGGIIS